MSAAAETSVGKGHSKAVWEDVRGPGEEERQQQGACACREQRKTESKKNKEAGNREELYHSKICYKL